MGFLDKAKQMAEQAQSKLDEVQKQFNESQSGSRASEGPPEEYDQHGRPVRSEAPPEAVAPDRTPPHGDTLGEQAPAPPPAPPAAATPDPAAPPPDDEDPYAPPKLTGGDPLAG
jgi:hypothetical protein